MDVATLIVSPLLQVIYEKLAAFLSSVDTFKGQKKNIKKLKEKLLLIQAVIEDAEEKQLKDKKVKHCLSKLRNVAYDAEDLLDEVTTQVLQGELVKEKWRLDLQDFKISSGHPVKSKPRRILTSIYEGTRRQVRITSFKLQSILSSFEMSSKLKEIVERFDDIAREMSTFGFCKVEPYQRSDTMEKRETGPYVDESGVYGREEDVKKIVDLLLSSDADSWVIPIVGIGGIGKTTLARLAYNDQRLDGQFDKKIWVSLYDKFSTKKLLSEILECVTENRCESSVMSVLQSQLRDSLYGKRYLLVMDDVWEDVEGKWDDVRNLLRCGAEGSKIIVTTRTEKVASTISSTPPHHLGALTKDDCWTLFKQQAFAHGEEDSFPNLLPIGQQIIDKCQGVPLAAKVLGGLLRSKREEDEWLRVRKSDLWNLDAGEKSILSVLRLSFNHLPSHLKRCFAYCAIFPRNHRLNKEKLIQQWIAGGLVQLSSGGDPEHIVNEWFDDLLKMSFFHLTSSSNVVEFIVPTLIYDLAKLVAGNEFLTIENSNQAQGVGVGGDPAGTRHALVDGGSRSNMLVEALYGAPKLSTLHLLASGDISMESQRNLFSRFRHLKILNLSGSGIKRMHRSIGDLIYLRYLDLSNTPLETLPETIGDLCNLQTLDLTGCTDLLELPEEIIKLVSLTHLNIKDCVRLARLPFLCFKILKQLQTLPIVFASEFTMCLKCSVELNPVLTNLQGELKIKHLMGVGPVVCFGDGPDQFLRSMQLHTLELFWGDGDESKLNRNTSRQISQTEAQAKFVMHCLQPDSKIRRLSINGYLGRQFPGWMHPDAVGNLTELELINCKSCETLPKLGQLPNLKCLNIQGMNNVVKIDNEFSGEGMRSFSSLIELTLRDFPELRTWESMGSTESFPCLKTLSIMKCPLLKTMPWFPALQQLKVQDCDPLLLRSVAELRTLLTLVIESFGDLPFIPKVLPENSSLLMSLTVQSCHKLQALPANLGKITALKSLKIGWCQMLDSLPQGLTNLISLENLEIIECPRLTTLPEQIFERLCSLRSLSIENCDSLTSLPTGMQHAMALEHLTIMYCNLASLPDGLQKLSALESLTFLSCPELASLPDGVQEMNKLQNLEIRTCPKLMALPKVNNLVSLRSLTISDCQNIKSLPEGIQQLSELQHLSIQDCPQLEERCRRGGGEDWQKISRIPYIYMGTRSLQNRQDTAASSSGS